MKKTILILIISLFVCNFLISLNRVPDTIKNSLTEIENKMGKITIELLYTWSDGNEKGHIFKIPSGIAVDNKGFVYIVDSALHCIKVFNPNRQFIRKIGRRGQGPGDILTPSNIGIDLDNSIWIFEIGNRRIQAFSKGGKSIAILKMKQKITSNIVFPSENQIAMFDNRSAKKGEGIISVFKYNGLGSIKIGEHMLPPQVDLPFAGGKYDYSYISFNRITKSYYVAYKYSQMIQQFREKGELNKCIFYDTPIHKLKLSWDSMRRNYNIVDKKKYYSECIDIDIDDKGQLFTVVSTRLPKENEGKSMVFYPDGIVIYKPLSKEYPIKTDMYRLLVFSPKGKILAAKQLNVFCDDIYIHKDRLYIIDKTFAQAIYEFKYNIKD